MNPCEKYAALLDLFLDGELTPEAMADVQAHLDGCPACRAYVDDILSIRAALPAVEDTPVPEGFAQGVMTAIRARTGRKRRYWVRGLASLAACCAIVVVLQALPGGGNRADAPAEARADAAVQFSEAVTVMENGALYSMDSDIQEPESAPAAADSAAPEEAEKAKTNGRTTSLSPETRTLTVTLTAEQEASLRDLLETYTLKETAPGFAAYTLAADQAAPLLERLAELGISPADSGPAEGGCELHIWTE